MGWFSLLFRVGMPLQSTEVCSHLSCPGLRLGESCGLGRGEGEALPYWRPLITPVGKVTDCVFRVQQHDGAARDGKLKGLIHLALSTVFYMTSMKCLYRVSPINV